MTDINEMVKQLSLMFQNLQSRWDAIPQEKKDTFVHNITILNSLCDNFFKEITRQPLRQLPVKNPVADSQPDQPLPQQHQS